MYDSGVTPTTYEAQSEIEPEASADKHAGAGGGTADLAPKA